MIKNKCKIVSDDFNPIDTNDILDIHKYLMKGRWYKIMFVVILKIFVVLLSNIVNGSNRTKCVSLNNEKCMIQPTLVNLHPNETVKNFATIPFKLN